MTGLTYPYLSVCYGGVPSYGGNQNRLERARLKRSACGVIACTDLLLYLHRHRPGCGTAIFSDDSGVGAVSEEVYHGWVRRFRRGYLPVIPYVGTIGVEIALALNRYFKRYGIPLRASWGVGKKRLWQSVEEMLTCDIPVILAVGANFPVPLPLHKLNFYREGQTAPACRTCAHFVTVTGMDEKCLRISSWGREYYIRREELWEYARRHSTFFLSSILVVRPA